MSKELIVRLREAAAQRVASTAMIGADDLIAAADALEKTEAARMAAISRLCEAEVACATACQERDAMATELKALREQKPVGFRFHGMVIAEYEHEESFWAKGWSFSEEKPKSHFSGIEHARDIEPLYAHPVPARELTDEDIGKIYIKEARHIEHATQREIAFARAIERHMKGEGK